MVASSYFGVAVAKTLMPISMTPDLLPPAYLGSICYTLNDRKRLRLDIERSLVPGTKNTASTSFPLKPLSSPLRSHCKCMARGIEYSVDTAVSHLGGQGETVRPLPLLLNSELGRLTSKLHFDGAVGYHDCSPKGIKSWRDRGII